jgi:hypothetical protein
VTELMSPPQIRRLREQYDDVIEIDVIDLFASQFGTFMHGKLEAKEVDRIHQRGASIRRGRWHHRQRQIDLQED